MPGLTTAWLGRHALHFEEIDSTNTWLKERLTSDLPQGTAVLASLQTAGKGRLGRQWSERRNTGLALSFLLRDFAPEAMPALPLAIGLGVCLALADLGPEVQAAIKWSNDVLLAEGEGWKKICGILCETRSGTGTVVAGMGVNLTQTRQQLEADGLVYATSVQLVTGQIWQPTVLAAHIANRLEPILEQLRAGGFAAIQEEYSRRCLTIGRQVRILERDGSARVGEALGVSPRGDLVCRMENGGEESIGAGEVSVRGLYGYV